MGALVALVGTLARTTLRETPDFADAKRRVKNRIEQCGMEASSVDSNPMVLEKVNKKTALAVFLYSVYGQFVSILPIFIVAIFLKITLVWLLSK